MKLLTKYSRINVLVTIAIFMGASAAFYFTLDYVLLDQVDDDLRIERREIATYLEKYNRLPEPVTVHDQVITYTPISFNDDKKQFTTINMQDKRDKDWEKFRQLRFSVQVGGQWFQITVAKSLEATGHLIRSILTITFSTILLILIASFIINRVVLKKLWQPFYDSLHQVKDFRISKDGKLTAAPTNIEEFSFMNQTLETLTRQARGDYLALKTFSEDASHEIQTPIAIIRSKLDLLIQEEELTQKQSESLGSAYNAVQRLTTLNQHLLLLARIENKQFDEIQEFDAANEVKKKLADFSELWNVEEIELSSYLEPLLIRMNPALANILLNNLLSNATRHNYLQGKIYIALKERKLEIKNTSKLPALDNSKIFRRFYKPSQSGSSNGLGLSIIKEICDASGFRIGYKFDDGLHTFSIYFE